MSHLHPFTQVFTIGALNITMNFTFGFHCFTDDKQAGKLIVNQGERRYFSVDRWHSSQQIVPWIQQRMLEATVLLYFDKKHKRRYFCLDIYDFALFLQISKPDNTTHTLKIHVISAYEVDQWGRPTLPTKGPRHNLSWVLSQRAQGINL